MTTVHNSHFYANIEFALRNPIENPIENDLKMEKQ